MGGGGTCLGAICQMFLSVSLWPFGEFRRPAKLRRRSQEVPMSRPTSHHPSRASVSGRLRGFPVMLVMCAAGDGGLAMLILLSGSGKYRSSLRRRKNNKEPSVAAACGVQRSHQNPSQCDASSYPSIRAWLLFLQTRPLFLTQGR